MRIKQWIKCKVTEVPSTVDCALTQDRSGGREQRLNVFSLSLNTCESYRCHAKHSSTRHSLEWEFVFGFRGFSDVQRTVPISTTSRGKHGQDTTRCKILSSNRSQNDSTSMNDFVYNNRNSYEHAEKLQAKVTKHSH